VFIRLVNNSGQAQPLNGVTLRYWFTGDGVSPYTLICDNPGSLISSCNQITGVNSAVSPIRQYADRLMTITLNTTQTLGVGANTGDIQLRFVKQDTTPTIQTNDYSHSATPSSSSPTGNSAIGMYRSDGTMVWGIAPSANYVCGNGVTDLGEVCDNGANTNCNGTCGGFVVNSGKACTNAAQCLHVEQYSSDSLTDGEVRPYFRIVNSGGVPIALNRMKVKYWFTSESATAGLTVGCTTGPGGNCSQMSAAVARISPTYATADAAVTVTFTATTQLGNTDMTNAMQFSVNRTDWANMPESNDWSQTKATTMTAAPKIALYVDDQLWWGEEAK
jgi:cellulose 1,4-beta-cellobiosidase